MSFQFADIFVFPKLAFSKPDCLALLKFLHTASFFIRNAKSGRVKAKMDNERVTTILNGSRRLRRLRVNDLQWEVSLILFAVLSGAVDKE